jgi:hypothetical protein
MRHGFAPETTPQYRDEFVGRWSTPPMSMTTTNGSSDNGQLPSTND